MSYQETISALARDPERLEQIYREARQGGETDAFRQAIDANTQPHLTIYSLPPGSTGSNTARNGQKVSPSPGGG
jgi:hypothetical protein